MRAELPLRGLHMSNVCDGCSYKSTPYIPPAQPRCTNLHASAHYAKACSQVEACRFSPLARRKTAQ